MNTKSLRKFSVSFARAGYSAAGPLPCFVAVALLLSAAPGRAQFGAPQTLQVHDASALHPPAGARVAIVEFADLECPACAHANPLLTSAAANYKLPWVRHDFLIPNHNWSRQAAIIARFFDTKATKSEALGNEYRDYIFANQISIESLADLNAWTQKFAAAHKIAMPFAVDPMGKFAAEVQADSDLGRRTGITQTPTVFIVIGNSKAPPYIQVLNIDQDLYRDIDQALAEAKR